MPDDKSSTATTSDAPKPATNDDAKKTDLPTDTDSKTKSPSPNHSSSEIQEIIPKINEAQNILIALSSDPSVDEMAAAIGLSLYLDKIGKRTTTIYSGTTPNALEFLKPEETFESTSDSLQDFVIALNKEKADHLRYKLDGDFVKIYITPYHTRITKDDLEFSYGDFNVDLVLALDVTNGVDLDSALREHGRIMHDATIINITTGNPGKLGEIEWSDKSSSSVSEMLAELIYNMSDVAGMDKEEATAFLTGIVAATNRFSNAKTSPKTMQLSSQLMESGANQQLISKNITPDTNNEMFEQKPDQETVEKTEEVEETEDIKEGTEENDTTKFNIAHEEVEDNQPKTATNPAPDNSTVLLDDLKAAEKSLAEAGAETTLEPSAEPLKIDSSNLNPASTQAEPASEETAPEATTPEPAPEPEPSSTSSPLESAPEETPDTTLPQGNTSTGGSYLVEQPEKVITPPNETPQEPVDLNTDKYGQMLESALSNINTPTETNAPSQTLNPAALNTPAVPSAPEINGVPEINYMPMPGEEILPPPPAPPLNMDMPATPAVDTSMATPSPEPSFATPNTMPNVLPTVTPIVPATPSNESQPPVNTQPLTPDQPNLSDPGAFKIPGM